MEGITGTKRYRKIIDAVFKVWWYLSGGIAKIPFLLIPKGSCRFYPTCSEYARQAFWRYGMILGIKLTLKRIGRCQPFASGGHDPLP